MAHDFSLNSGERQTATRFEEIRADHRYRYEWADRILPAMTGGLDMFCGIGYGTWLLSHKRWCWGIDGSAEAIAAARRCYARPSAQFAVLRWPFRLPAALFDFIVSLESVEHVSDGPAMFAAMAQALRPGGWLIYSAPNEDLLPHAGMGNHFHFRHYTLGETLALATTNGLTVEGWAGQDAFVMQGGRPVAHLPGDDQRLETERPGQFTIAAARRA